MIGAIIWFVWSIVGNVPNVNLEIVLSTSLLKECVLSVLTREIAGYYSRIVYVMHVFTYLDILTAGLIMVAYRPHQLYICIILVYYNVIFDI